MPDSTGREISHRSFQRERRSSGRWLCRSDGFGYRHARDTRFSSQQARPLSLGFSLVPPHVNALWTDAKYRAHGSDDWEDKLARTSNWTRPGILLIVSAGSSSTKAIALVMAFRRMLANDTFERFKTFDNLAMLLKLAVIAAVVLIAGQLVAPLFIGIYAVMFWGGTVLLGLLIPLALNLFAVLQAHPRVCRAG